MASGPVEVVAPPGTAQRPSGGAARANANRQRRPDDDVAFGRVAVGQVDDGLRPAQRLGHLAGLNFVAIAVKDSPTVKVGSPIDSTSAMCSEASRDASRTRPCMQVLTISPAMPMASDALSPAAVHNSRNSSNSPSEMSA